MIENDTDLMQVVNEINERLQQVQDYLGERNVDKARLRFPRGYLRKCAEHREKYPFIQDKVLKSNIAYAKMTTDIFRWMMNRTDLMLTAKEMIIKQGISIIGAVAESIIKVVLAGQPGGGNKQNFKKKVETLHNTGRINAELKSDLEWLWDVRNDVHLMLLEEKEHNKYKMEHYNRAIKTLIQLRVSLGGKP